MKKLHPSVLLAGSLALAALAACGKVSGAEPDAARLSDGAPGTPDAAPPIDAPPPPITDQYLDETCTGTEDDCGGLLTSMDYVCLAALPGDSIGICASLCWTDIDCLDGYDGPSGGEPACEFAAPDGTTYCTIRCTAPEHCPAGMSCTDFGGGRIFCTADQT